MNLLLNAIRALPVYTEILDSAKSGKTFMGLGLPRAARLPMLACLREDLDAPILLLTDRADRALEFADELSFWLKDSSSYLFSEPNPLFYENAIWGAINRRERIQALTALASYHLPFAPKPDSPPVIISSTRALMARTLPRREFLKASKRLKIGDKLLITSLLETWVKIGYEPANTVLEPGQFSHRGGLLDIWASAEKHPVRLDFFGNELDIIKSFDPASQRTIDSLKEILITPAKEYLLPNPELSDIVAPDSQFSEFHIPILHPFPASLIDYLPANALVLIDDISFSASTADEIEEQAVKFREESIKEEVLDEDFPIPYLSWSELEDALHNRSRLELGYSTARADMPSDFSALPRFNGRLKPFMDFVAERIASGDEVFVASRQCERLSNLWQERHSFEDSEYKSPNFICESLSGGWSLVEDPKGLNQAEVERESLSSISSNKENTSIKPFGSIATHLITDSEIFGWQRPRPRRRQRIKADAPEAVYADFKSGDWVVHIDHGIGKYTGLVQRALSGEDGEFLQIEYKGEARLYVPVYQADRVTRYVGAEGGTPAQSRLGAEGWDQAKKRVRRAVEEVADDLVELYARRKIASGFPFNPDSEWQKELEASFPYVETDDQLRVLDEIKRDMERALPMDRLLCGDVGYGKTEVALRAAFKAVTGGKQVAILAPTTVLAQQHFDTFQRRMGTFPVKVEMISRFRTAREQSKILLETSKGGVDILIGTHRLFSSDVIFKDLGLVIVDEEQRFGVAHKEHLKKMRAEVDVLTMTATPIPRTLYMALTGVRDISNLNTPPEERLPIVTHVGPYAPKLVRQAILREIDRGGQVFFVHNRVQTILAMKAHLRKLVPEANVSVGHGQMPKTELERVMSEFTGGKVDVLLSTTIIESGLDIPNANTLIVDRGDTFGLAQLYQLRGRVGRGARRAYAYFFRHRKKMPTEEGQMRLEVLAENTQLGAGYTIAMRDLEIRGAGDLLGTRQTGHISSVGFHLYTRLLAEAVANLKFANGKEEVDDNALADLQSAYMHTFGIPVNINFSFAVGIPASYIPDQNLRLQLYRRLTNIADESELDALRFEFMDRFGTPPEMVENFFYQISIKMRAEAAGLASVTMSDKQIILRYPPLPDGRKRRLKRDFGRGTRSGRDAYYLNIGARKDWRGWLLGVLGEV